MTAAASWVAQDYSQCRQMPPWQKLRGSKKNSSRAREEKILLGNEHYVTRFDKKKIKIKQIRSYRSKIIKSWPSLNQEAGSRGRRKRWHCNQAVKMRQRGGKTA